MQLWKTFALGGRNFKGTGFNLMTNTSAKVKSYNNVYQLQLQLNTLHNQFIHTLSSHFIVQISS